MYPTYLDTKAVPNSECRILLGRLALSNFMFGFLILVDYVSKNHPGNKQETGLEISINKS